MTDARQLAEKYGRATMSSNLDVDPDERGDADYLIAAGWNGADLGAMLLRLRAEWGLASGGYMLAVRAQGAAQADATRAHREAQALEAAAAKLAGLEDGPGKADVLRIKARMHRVAAAAALTDAARTTLTAQAVALTHLKTLREAKAAVAEFGLHCAERMKYEPGAKIVEALAHRALQTWLDAICHDCEGRGYNGGCGSPMVLCTACGSTGRTAHHIDRDRPGELMATLLALLDRKCHQAERAMGPRLSQREEAPDKPAAELARTELQGRLAELRSTEAERD